MDTATYDALVASLRATPVSAFPYLARIASRYAGVSVSTVYSIYSQEVQYHVMKTHKALCEASPALLRQYLCGNVTIMEVCENWRLPPCIVLRRLFECCSLLSRKNPNGGVSRSAIAAVFKDPTALASFVSEDCIDVLAEELGMEGLGDLYGGGGAVGRRMLLERLQRDVEDCVLVDCICGPDSDRARRAAGLEFEGKLYEYLDANDICFWTEEELRDLKYIKTPDALLKVPIAVHGRVVSWIDSKATFCDVKSHARLLKGQYESYVNRFGPGLVIYWHGYLKEIEGHGDKEQTGVLVMAEWPEDIVTLPRLASGQAEDERKTTKGRAHETD